MSSILWNNGVPYFKYSHLQPLLQLMIAVTLGTQLRIWISSFYSLQMYGYWQEGICKSASALLRYMNVVPQTWHKCSIKELDLISQFNQFTLKKLQLQKKRQKQHLKKSYFYSSPLKCTCSLTQNLKGLRGIQKGRNFFSVFCAA